jgi:hypothetical protein
MDYGGPWIHIAHGKGGIVRHDAEFEVLTLSENVRVIGFSPHIPLEQSRPKLCPLIGTEDAPNWGKWGFSVWPQERFGYPAFNRREFGKDWVEWFLRVKRFENFELHAQGEVFSNRLAENFSKPHGNPH